MFMIKCDITEFLQCEETFIHSVQTNTKVHSNSCSVGIGGSFPPVVKLSEREAVFLPPSIAEVKSVGVISSLPHMSIWHGD
jgi:hypothetical protein